MRRIIVISCLLSLALAAFAACSDDSDESGVTPVATSATTPSSQTPQASATPRPTALISIQTAENTVEFGHDPVSVPATGADNVQLTLVQAGSPGDFDRMLFQFDGALPGYEIRYVPGPIQGCASGQDEQIAGQAFLQIRMQPAVAHDEQGNPSATSTDLQPGLTVMQQAKQICDFEGVVTWVLGLASEVDYRVNTVGGGILVVDVKHP